MTILWWRGSGWLLLLSISEIVHALNYTAKAAKTANFLWLFGDLRVGEDGDMFAWLREASSPDDE